MSWVVRLQDDQPERGVIEYPRVLKVIVNPRDAHLVSDRGIEHLELVAGRWQPQGWSTTLQDHDGWRHLVVTEIDYGDMGVPRPRHRGNVGSAQDDSPGGGR